MSTSKVIYKGNLRTIATHLASRQGIITDAPLDNKGKGEAFSPTDLAATSLACCMVTIMGIASETHNIEIKDTEIAVTKHMVSDPRRIGAIDVVFTMPVIKYTKKEKKILEIAAKTCPVAMSLHPDIKQNVTFIWA
ncbi:MAG: OsmC family protein [Saprospiraceae bacterium]|nr:OsmC family protein [Saprospiraceae bacterium]